MTHDATVQEAMTTPDQLHALKTFARRILAEAQRGGLDTYQTQQMGFDLGLCVTEAATPADVEDGFDGAVGETIFRLHPWLEETLREEGATL